VGGAVTIEQRFPSVGFDPARAARVIETAGLAGVFLASPENVFYTTGYTSLPSSGNPILYTLRGRLPYFSLVAADGQVTLGCWAFSAEGVDYGADVLAGFNSHQEAVEQAVQVARTATGSSGRLGVESTCPRFLAEAIGGALPGVTLVDCDDVLDELRLIKTDAELALLRRSTNIIEDVVGELYDVLHVGLTRDELMRQARGRLMEHGAGGISHLTFSFGRTNPEVEVAEPLEPGALVTLDLGAIFGGYCSDNRRYAYTGAVPPEVTEKYQKMVAIVDAVGDMLVPGASYRQIYADALELHRTHGVEPLARFTHVGHNIGLETEEQWLDDRPDATVRAGMAINIELYTITDAGNQIGNEETYFVTESGPERVSVLPRVIREVTR
jgi:Xaa-Pro aminopeptidase